jgi:hypothetical protein
MTTKTIKKEEYKMKKVYGFKIGKRIKLGKLINRRKDYSIHFKNAMYIIPSDGRTNGINRLENKFLEMNLPRWVLVFAIIDEFAFCAHPKQEGWE